MLPVLWDSGNGGRYFGVQGVVLVNPVIFGIELTSNLNVDIDFIVTATSGQTIQVTVVPGQILELEFFVNYYLSLPIRRIRPLNYAIAANNLQVTPFYLEQILDNELDYSQ